MGSGVIYAVLVVMWAAYFIPRWLRRHEELSESRSVERFDTAMRVLSRREATPDRRAVVMPPRPAAATEPLATRRTSGVTVPAQRARPQARRRPSPATIRRRRVLVGMLPTVLVTAALSPLTALPWWVPVLGVVAVLAFLVHCRLQARTRHEVKRTREAVRKRARSRLLRFDTLDRIRTLRRELAEEKAAEELRWAEMDAAMERERLAEEERAAAGGWNPVPVPLPTYVTKPVAPRRAEPIDLTRPGAWTAAQPVPEQTSAAPAPNGMSHLLDDADEAESDLDAILHRRAVND